MGIALGAAIQRLEVAKADGHSRTTICGAALLMPPQPSLSVKPTPG